MPENVTFHYPDDASEEYKSKIQAKVLENLVGGLDVESLSSLDNEIIKEQWQIEAIRKINNITKQYFKAKFNFNIRDLTPDDIHILKPKDMVEVLKEMGKYNGEVPRGLSMNRHMLLSTEITEVAQPKLEFIKGIIHELLHTNEFKKMTEIKIRTGMNEYKIVSAMREGVSMRKPDKFQSEWRFQGLSEGITEMFSKEVLHQVVSSDPAYQKEVDDKFSNVFKKVSREELIGVMGLRSYDVIDVDVVNRKDGGKKYSWYLSGTYLEEQELIFFVAANIARVKSDKYKSINEVMDLFFNAQYKGELLPLGREVDEIFGPGTFRLLSAIPAEHSNIIAMNTIKFLKLPLEQRDPKIAETFIFTSHNKADYKKYLSANKDIKSTN